MTGLLIGVIAPILLWLVFHIFLWPLCVVGGMILGAFVILFAIEMHQDFGKTLTKETTTMRYLMSLHP